MSSQDVKEAQAMVDDILNNAAGSGSRTEVLVAFWSHDETAEGVKVPMWLFREENVSPMFIQAFGVHWYLRVYSYDTWKDVIEVLNEKATNRAPHRLEVDMTYFWRMWSEGELEVVVYFHEVRVAPLSIDFLLDNVDTGSTAK